MIGLDQLRDAVGDGYVYLASPYSKHTRGMEYAFVEASKGAAFLISNHIPTFCPIAHSHPIAVHGEIPAESHDIWLPADRPLMEGARALCVLMLESWRDSYGVGVEIEEFNTKGKRVFYMTDYPYHVRP